MTTDGLLIRFWYVVYAFVYNITFHAPIGFDARLLLSWHGEVRITCPRMTADRVWSGQQKTKNTRADNAVYYIPATCDCVRRPRSRLPIICARDVVEMFIRAGPIRKLESWKLRTYGARESSKFLKYLRNVKKNCWHVTVRERHDDLLYVFF